MPKFHEKWWVVAPLSIGCTLAFIHLTEKNSVQPIGRNDSPAASAPVAEVYREPVSAKEQREYARNPGPGRNAPASGETYIRVPKGITNHLFGSFYNEESGIDESLAATLGIDDHQRAEINRCIGLALPELRRLEADHSQLKTDEDGNQYFEIAPYDGGPVKKSIDADLMRILGDDRAVLLSEVFGKSGNFSHFGKYPQEIAFEEMFFDETGKRVMRLKVTFHTGGSNSSSYALAPGMKEVIRKRFGLLYERAGIPLQTE